MGYRRNIWPSCLEVTFAKAELKRQRGPTTTVWGTSSRWLAGSEVLMFHWPSFCQGISPSGLVEDTGNRWPRLTGESKDCSPNRPPGVNIGGTAQAVKVLRPWELSEVLKQAVRETKNKWLSWTFDALGLSLLICKMRKLDLGDFKLLRFLPVPIPYYSTVAMCMKICFSFHLSPSSFKMACLSF